SNSPTYDAFHRWVDRVVTEAVQERRFVAAHADLSRERIKAIMQPVPVIAKGLSARNAQTGEIEEGADENPVASLLIPGGLMMLMFMMVLVGSTPLMQGVVEEKMQRIAEVLLGSVQPFQLMMGKLLGMVGVSLTLAVVYLGGAYWAAYRYDVVQFIPLDVLL